MKPVPFLALAALTVVVVVAALIVAAGQRSTTAIPTERERAFADLEGRENDAASLEVVTNETGFTLVRAGGGWGMRDRAGYPVHYDRIKSAVVGLAELKLLEAKTSDPARYERLQLREPEDEGAQSVRFEIRDGGGAVLASGVIGKRNPSLFGEGGGGTYLRRGADAQSWLAEGEVTLGRTRNDWLVRDVVDVDAEDVRRAVIRQPDGAEIVVRKDARQDESFALDGVPDGRELKDSSEGKNIAGGLWRLTFEDVKPEGEVAFPESFNVAEYETFDGLRVRAEMTTVDGVVWGRFTASAGDGEGEAAAAAREKAKEIADRAKGWVYELSAGEGERLTTRIEDILKPPEKGS